MPVPTISSLGVILDAFLSMEVQVINVARTVFYHLWLVSQLVPYLISHNLATESHAMVTSRLDFCKSLYVGLPWNLI